MYLHLLLGLYSLTVASFLGAILYSEILIRRFNYSILNYVRPINVMGVLLSSVMTLAFYCIYIVPSPRFITFIFESILSLIIASIIFVLPYLFLNIYSVPLRKKYLTIHAALAVLCVIMIALPFLPFGNLVLLEDSPLQGLGIYTTMVCLLGTICTQAYLSRKHKENLKSPLIKSLLQETMLLSLIFLPGFAHDLLWSEFQKYGQILPEGIFFCMIFFLVQNLIIMRRSHGIIMSYDLKIKKNPHVVFAEYGLSKREKELALLALGGHSNQGIADKLYISLPTVKTHLKNIYRKIGIKSRAELMALVQSGDMQ